jgi:hypothetical protein
VERLEGMLVEECSEGLLECRGLKMGSGKCVVHGLLGRASTKPPTPLRNAEWGTLRGDLWVWQEEEMIIDFYF